jgi:hypothetical protein
VQSLGIPVVLLAALLWAGWRCAAWVAPRLNEVFQAHLALVGKVKDSVESFGRTLDGMLASIEAVLKNQEDIRKDLGDIKNHVGFGKQKDE